MRAQYYVIPTVALLTLPILIYHPVVLHIFIYVFFYAYFALAWAILGVLAGQLSLGHSVFFGIGAYTAVILHTRYAVTPWASMFVGGGLAALTGFLLGFPCFRLKGGFYALATLALTEIMRLLAIYFVDVTGGAEGITVPLIGESPLYFQFTSKAPYYYVMFILLVVMVLVYHKISGSKLGYQLQAIREDEDAASSLGINVFLLKLKAAAISAFFTGVLGVFYVQYTRFIHPESAFGLWRAAEPIIISALGGPGVLGPLVGSSIITPTLEVLVITLGGRFATVKMMIQGAILMAIILKMPTGITSPLTRLLRKTLPLGGKKP
ncbi:MAG: branched-chain amino acid ABC transporter permease [Candidatus Nezhaarchaeales archaeon]